MAFSPVASVVTPSVTSDPKAGHSAFDSAVLRPLDSAVARSEARVARLLNAARDLTDERGDASFTVADVARRSSLSLKSFYRCFSGKDELLLALLEQETRIGATMLATFVDRAENPGQRLREYVTGLFELARQAPGYAGVLAREHRRLGVGHPAALNRALAPLIDLLRAEIAAAAAAGVARPGDPCRAADLVFGVLVAGLAEVAMTGRPGPDVAPSIWRFVAGGLRIDDDPPTRDLRSAQ